MEALGEGVSTPKIRVLVADDEEVIIQTLATILNLAGYEICALYDGEAAMKLLDFFKPNLIVTDVTTPGLTGKELAFAAQTTLPRCKILVFTGHFAMHQILGHGPAGLLPFELITKPIRPADLLTRLKDMICAERPALLIPIDLEDTTVH